MVTVPMSSSSSPMGMGAFLMSWRPKIRWLFSLRSPFPASPLGLERRRLRRAWRRISSVRRKAASASLSGAAALAFSGALSGAAACSGTAWAGAALSEHSGAPRAVSSSATRSTP